MTKLVGISGNKVEEITKKPPERNYQFTIMTPGGGTETFDSYGVLVVTPGFVGIGDQDQTEIRTVVPLGLLVKVVAVGPSINTPVGSA